MLATLFFSDTPRLLGKLSCSTTSARSGFSRAASASSVIGPGAGAAGLSCPIPANATANTTEPAISRPFIAAPPFSNQ